MKFKKLMLVAMVLLAVLTIGAVSASDDTDFNETLTVEDSEDVSVDASLDDEIVSESGDDEEVVAASEIDEVSDEDLLSDGEMVFTVDNSSIALEKTVFDFEEDYEIEVNCNLTGASDFNATVIGYPDDEESPYVVYDDVVYLRNFNAGTYTVQFTTVPDDGYVSVVVNYTITINKIDSSFTLNNTVFDFEEDYEIEVNFTLDGAVDLDCAVIGYPEFEGPSVSWDDVVYLRDFDVGNYTVQFNITPDENHNEFAVNYTITINKIASSVSVEDVVADNSEPIMIIPVLEGATGVNASIVECPDVEIAYLSDGGVIISGLAVGNYTLKVITIPDDNHYAVENTSRITVRKGNSSVVLANIVFDYGKSGACDISLTGAIGVIASVVGHEEAIVNVSGTIITVSNLDAGNYTLKVVTIPDADHYAVEATVNITVNRVDSSVVLEKTVFDFEDDYEIEVNFTLDGAADFDGVVIGYPEFGGPYVSWDDDVVYLRDFGAGIYTVQFTTVPDDNHKAAVFNVTVIINKIDSSFTLNNTVFDFEEDYEIEVNFTLDGAVDLDCVVIGYPEFGGPYVSWDEVVYIRDFDAGIYTVQFTITPDENHNEFAVNYTITINKIDTLIELNDTVFNDGDEIIVPVRVTGSKFINAVVEGYSDVEISYSSDESDIIGIIINGLVAGNYTLNVTAVADENHNAAEANAKITINEKPDLPLTVNVSDINFSDDVVVSISSSENVTVHVTLADRLDKDVYLENGYWTSDYTIGTLDPGVYTVYVLFEGNEYYAQTSVSKNFTVSKAATEISIYNDTVWYAGEDLEIIIDEGADGNMTVTFGDNDPVTLSCGEHGLCYFTIPEDVAEGVYTVVASYGGNELFAPASFTTNINVMKKPKLPLTLNISDITYGEDLTVLISAGADVDVGVMLNTTEGVFYFVQIVDGSANCTFSNVYPGLYTLTVMFEGNEDYLKTVVEKNVTVNKISTSIHIDTDVVSPEEPFCVFFVIDEGATGVLKVIIDGGEPILVEIEDEYPYLDLNKTLPAGNHTVEVIYDGDEFFAPATVTGNVTVLQKPDLPLTVNVSDVYFYEGIIVSISSSENVTVHVTLADRLDKDVNLENGYWTSDDTIGTLDPGVYTVYVLFEGNEYYAQTSVSKNFTVSKAATEISIYNDTVWYAGEDLVIMIGEGADGNMTVTFGDNDPVTLSCGEHGLCLFTIPYDVAEGVYTVVASYGGNELFAPVSFTTNINVMKKPKLPLTVNISDITYGEDLTVLISADADVDVGVMLNTTEGVFYFVQIVDGSANCTFSNVYPGLYTVTVMFEGNDDYLKTVVEKNVTVNKAASSVSVEDAVVDYGEQVTVIPVLDGAIGVNASIVDHPEIEIAYLSDGGIVISGLESGIYTLKVITIPDADHYAVENTSRITVNKGNSSVRLADVVFNYGESGTSVAIFTGATGVTASIVGHEEANVSVSGNVITVSNLDAGNYTLKVVTIPDDDHYAVEATAKVTVNKVDSSVVLEKTVFDFEEDYEIEVNFTFVGAEDFDAIVIGYPEFEGPYVSWDDVVYLRDFDAGTYTVQFTTVPDDNHNAAVFNLTVIINKIDSSFAIDKTVFDFEEDYEIEVNFTLDGAIDLECAVIGYPEFEGPYVSWDDVVYLRDFDAGVYTVQFTTVPDDNYNAVVVNYTVIVNKIASTVSVEDAVFDYGEQITVIPVLDGATGVNASIVDHPEIEIAYLSDGGIVISGLGVNNYTLKVVTIPDENHYAVENTSRITVNKGNSSVRLADVVFNYGESGTSVAIFTGATGVTASIVGHEEAIVSVRGNIIAISNLDAGNYTLKVVTIPDDDHYAVEATAKVTVNKVDSSVVLEKTVFDFEEDYEIEVNFTFVGAEDFDAIVIGYPEFEGPYVSWDDVVYLRDFDAGTYTVQFTTVPDDNHNAAVFNLTVIINKLDSSFAMEKTVFDFEEDYEIEANFTLDGAIDLECAVIGYPEFEGPYVSWDDVVYLRDFNAGNYTVQFTTVPDGNHNEVVVNYTVIVNKIASSVRIVDIIPGSGDQIIVFFALNGAVDVDASIVDHPEIEIDNLGNGTISIQDLDIGNYTLKVVTIPDENHNAAEKTTNITVFSPIVTNDNFNDFFNEDGELITSISELRFAGIFENKILNINKPVTLIGDNAIFRNVQFKIASDNVVIRNMEMTRTSGANPIIEILGVDTFTLQNNVMTFNTQISEACVILVNDSNNVNIIDNNIKSYGPEIAHGILVYDSNFTIDSNVITISQGEEAEAIYLIGSSNGNVSNNDISVVASEIVYGINTDSNSTSHPIILFLYNKIYGEALRAIGINDDSETIGSNKVILKAKEAVGLIINSENANVAGNNITLIADSNSTEGCATGIQVNVKSNIIDNVIDSFDKSISVDGGCATTISNNNMNAPIVVATNDNILSGNNIVTDKESAIVLLGSSSNNNIDNNILIAKDTEGNEAVSDQGTGNTISNNKDKLQLSIGPIADVFEGQDVVIVITANKNFTGKVNVQVGSYNATASLTNGTGSINVAADKLSVGNVSVKVTFNGDDRYTNDTANTTFTVKAKVATVIKATAVTTTYGTSKNIVVTLTDANNNALAGQKVIVSLNGNEKELTTDANGKVSYAVGTKLAAKTYTATITFNGDVQYLKYTVSAKVKVNKATPKLTAKKKTFKVKKSKKYSVTLKTDKNKALNKVKVTITIKAKGKKIKITKTTKKGKVTFNLKKLTKKGKYTATVKCAGNKNYKAVTKKAKITVK